MYRIFGPKGGIIVRAATVARVRKILAGLKRRFGRVRVVNLARPRPRRFAMYDAIIVADLPADAAAYAGYVNGHWPTWPVLAATHPHAKRLSIAVFSDADADCLDIETGDATPASAPAWVRRQHARGLNRPVAYANRSTMPAVIRALRAAGIKRSQVRLWVADYTGRPHLPILSWGARPTRADACQWTDKAHGRSLDESLCAPGFLP
jgi:hypothetical protein